VSRDAPGELRFGFGRAAQLGSGVDRHQARHDSDGVAVVVALEQARLGKGLARSCSVEDEATPLGRHANKLQDTFAHEDEPESRVACAEQSLAAIEAAITALRQRWEKMRAHMTAIIRAERSSALPASVMNHPTAFAIAAGAA
jgi:uncharacterized coiled-coil protein SlyX